MLFKKIIKIIVLVCLVFTISCLLLYISLPAVVESQIHKRLPGFFDPDEIQFHIQKLGFYNTFISKIRITKGITIDSADIEYNIQNPSSICIKKITISGLTVHAELDENNQIRIQGFEFLKSLPESSSGSGQPGRIDQSFIKYLPEKIVLQNGKIILHGLDKEFLIPFDVLSTLKSDQGKIIARTLVYPFGEKINTLVTYDLNKGVEFIKIYGKAFDLGHIDQFVSKITGRVQLRGAVDFDLESSMPQKEWKINVSQVKMARPLSLALKNLTATLLMDDGKLNAGGSFDLFYSPMPETSMEYELSLDFNRNLKNKHYFDLKFKNKKIPFYKIIHESGVVNLNTPRLQAHFTGIPLKIRGTIDLGLEKGLIQHKKDEISLGKIKISSDVSLDYTDTGKGLNSEWIISANNIKAESKLVESSFPLVNAKGWLGIDKKNAPSLGVILKAFDGKIISSEFKVKASDIDIELPFSYPHVKKQAHGKFSISHLVYDNQYRFNTQGKILQTRSKEIHISAQTALKRLPDLKLELDSLVSLEKGVSVSLDFKTNKLKLTDTDMVKFTGPKIQNASIDAFVMANGKLEFLNNQLNTFMQLNVSDGNISISDMNFIATGINTKIAFNDLLVPESDPGQILTIDLIEINQIRINDAMMRFSIEDGRSLLVENIRFNWCNGLVTTESIRIPQKDNIYAVNLYCDRLELVQLLKQMGAFHAEGTGTLNGRIPIIYSDGNIAFDNGFLFSTPGSGGKVVIADTDMLTAGIPMDSPQFAQLDLAQEALKDFEYKWTKLKFHTFEDTLFVNMELDGKPSQLLPFEYKKEFGGFVRVDASSPGSNFQGIKLDVNLKLPFNDVVKFGNKIKAVFN